MSNLTLPARNPSFEDIDCYYHKVETSDLNAYVKNFNRQISDTAVNLKLQYFSLEKELLKSFEYVNPVEQNLQASSIKFATIIRESANLYEQTSRLIFGRLFLSNDRLNILNYLSLEVFLNLNGIFRFSPILSNISSGTDLLKPFRSLEDWDQQSQLSKDHIPQWWKAYNKLKHSPDEVSENGTMENAIKSLLAAHLIIDSFYGPGVVCGDLIKPELRNSEIIHTPLFSTQSELFQDPIRGFGFSF